MTSIPLVCTVLPTYNERANIRPLIERLLAANRPPYLVLVVDDDSPDGTWREVDILAARAFPDLPTAGKSGKGSVVLLRRVGEKGLTSAIQRGIDAAIQVYGAAIVTWMDCDLSMPPEDVPKLVQAIDPGGADVAVGSRWASGGADVAHGPMARTLSWIINHWAMLLLGRQVHDYTSGFIAARAEVLEQIRLQGDYGEYCIDLLARAGRLGYRLQEVPYVCVPRTMGDSKTGANLGDYLDKGRNYVATIIKLWREK
jgi:dolichol-phosphate mannosyltransferase